MWQIYYNKAQPKVYIRLEWIRLSTGFSQLMDQDNYVQYTFRHDAIGAAMGKGILQGWVVTVRS